MIMISLPGENGIVWEEGTTAHAAGRGRTGAWEENDDHDTDHWTMIQRMMHRSGGLIYK